MTHDLASPRFRFGIRFSLLARRWRQALDAGLAAAELTDATWVPLVHIEESGGGLTQKALAQRVGVDGSSLVRVIDILARQGLIERRPDPTDGRARRIFLTAAGTGRVADIRRELSKVEADILAELTDDEIGAMLAGFEKIDARLDALQETGTKGVVA